MKHKIRLIDADEIMKSIDDNSYFVSQKYNSIEKGMTLTGIKQFIEEQPTIDAEQVRHGKLIKPGICTLNCIVGKCALCGGFNIEGAKYCQWCGAKMDGGEADGA